MRTARNFLACSIALALAALVLLTASCVAKAQTDCLACHDDKTAQDSAGKSINVDGKVFHSSIHSSLGCNACHADIKGFPHPDKIKPVDCKACHADEAAGLVGSVHSNEAEHPCTSCHGNAHAIVPKSDPKSTVYPLNVPKTCGQCHGDNGMAEKHGLAKVFPKYIDSIHGYALDKEGLLVAANCESCHGSHHILSRKDPVSPTNKVNIPKTCGSCHAGINTEYAQGVHGLALAKGNTNAPVCTDCHTAHEILHPTDSEFRMQSTPICGSCHKEMLSTYRDTFHSQLGALGGYVETARCWDCHGAHDIRRTADPSSPVNPANLIATCGKCHSGANASFVKYQPHANAYNRTLSPGLYFVRLFMNLLLASVLSFFLLHTILWLFRARYNQIKHKNQNGGK